MHRTKAPDTVLCSITKTFAGPIQSPHVSNAHELFATDKEGLAQSADAFYLQSGTADVLPLLEALDATTFAQTDAVVKPSHTPST
jgi:hypothetical protein